jgi:hypothetical protein
MTGRKLKFIILFFSILVFLLVTAICVYGILHTKDFDNRLAFGATILRVLILLIFQFFYYSSMFSGLGVDSAFLPLFVLSSSITELKILGLFSQVTSFCPYSPFIVISVIEYFYIFSGLSLFCFSYFYQEREQSVANTFLLFSLIFSALVVYFLPRFQDFESLDSALPFSILLACVYTVAGILALHHIVTDPPGTYLVRHFSALLFLAGNIVNLYFNTRVSILVGTAYILISYVSVIVISKVSDIKY